jgi:hypothetical protein
MCAKKNIFWINLRMKFMELFKKFVSNFTKDCILLKDLTNNFWIKVLSTDLKI